MNSSEANYEAGRGQGSNYFYNIVQFVGVKIVVLPGQQTNKQIVVQPSATIDPNAIFDAKGATLLDTTSGTLMTTFTTPKLTN